jgi:spermidine synthase
LSSFIPPFLLGFLASSFQIILLREFAAYFYGNELTLGIVLASWLLCAGLGSLLVPDRRPGRPIAGLYEAAILFLPLALVAVRLSRFVFRTLPGQQVGLAGAVLAALAASLLVSFPLGRLFPLNVSAAGGRLARVYILESLGAALGGFFLQWALLPRLSNWEAAAAVGAFGLALVNLLPEPRRWRISSLAVVGVLAALVVLDMPSQREYWKPFSFAGGRDTRYGKLQVVRTGEQVSFYANGARAFSRPDPAAGEDAIHFALLQDPLAASVLLIGGGAGGSLDEVLKYPRARVDYVELDPELIELAREFLGEDARRTLDDKRVRLHFQDGRGFLQSTRKRYEMIILDLPGPATAQLNRFYTREFFALVKQRLSAGGVFSFGAASSENYIGPELRDLLASLRSTLASVFPTVKVVPGDRNIFLASTGPLSIDPAELDRRIREYALETTYVNGAFLYSRLHPLRLSYLEGRLSAGASRLNSDLTPATFFFESLFWSRQFRGFETRILRWFSSLPVPVLLAFPLALLLPWLVFFRVRRTRSGYLLTPLVIMGLTTIMVEVVVLVWFQSLYGYLYGRLALLLSSFMLGLFAGAWASSRVRSVSAGRLSLSSLGVVLLLAAFLAVMAARPPVGVPFLLLFLFGALAGDIFIVANRLFLGARQGYGLGYGLELLGSFLGALATSSLLIPLAGLRALLASVLVLNLLGLAFLLARPRDL